ncbi:MULTISPECIES: UDP-4-amino-4,6-dideoxy-N-acetyl-beta-L-altrosamine transaminase [Rhizobium/Agrobacterium group]|uniref:UDP-4-amino-4, 6-dideoxy-N-acetyl-beta-L-altrosamine transaminase n=1 Tax=Rhizobium oryzihabitans TaxID=2267833 RepID=UPI0040333D8D
MIPYGRQDINQADIDAVVEVLKSDWLTQGPVVPRFETAVASYVGARRAVASNSATSSLHLACLALGVGPGDEVWTSPVSFVASANCARYCGASIDFVDIDGDTGNISVDALAAKLLEAERDGKLPKVVIPVHLAGQSCDMQAIGALATRYGFRVIEDASHAIGGRYQDSPIGDCRFSDIVVFSFHPVKVVTSGEGGMAVTNDDLLADRMALLRSHGITRDPEAMESKPDGPWYYEQIDLGFNYRMTELQAALGCSQMDRLAGFVARRHEIAKAYEERLADLPLGFLKQEAWSYSAYHLFVVRLDAARAGKSHLEVFEALRSGGIGVNLHYIPIYRQPDFRQFGQSAESFPNAERYYREAISIPMYAALDPERQDEVISVVRAVVSG